MARAPAALGPGAVIALPRAVAAPAASNGEGPPERPWRRAARGTRVRLHLSLTLTLLLSPSVVLSRGQGLGPHDPLHAVTGEL